MQSKSQYWDQFYKKNDPENTPWTGSSEQFLNNIWDKFSLPDEGNLLDVGCGRGDKAIFLADNYNFRVWAFDISEIAIKEAKEASKSMNNHPIFFVSDAEDLAQAVEIKGVKFNVIIDFVSTQFMPDQNKIDYLKALRSHIIPRETFYLLNTFVKDNEQDMMKGYAEWVKKIAQSPEMVEDTYLKYFSIEEEWVRLTPKGKVGTYILLAN